MLGNNSVFMRVTSMHRLLKWLVGVFLIGLQPMAYGTELTLVTYIDTPLVYLDQSEPKGVVVEVVKSLMARAGIHYKIRFMPPKRAIVMAKKTPGFCVFPISRSQEREAAFQWVSPVLISRHALYSTSGAIHPLHTLKEAKPFRIGSTLGDAVGEYLSDLGYNIDNTARNELNVEKLSLNRIDLWLSDTLSAPYLAAKKGVKLNPSELIFFTTLRSMGCHKDMDPGVIKALQDKLNNMYRTGVVRNIYDQLGLPFQQ